MAQGQAGGPRRRGAREPRRRRRLSTAAPRSPAGRGAVDDVLSRRIVFVAGKGGSGKSTISAALALIAGRRGRRVLLVEADAKGDAAAALGHSGASFEPVVVQPNVSVASLQPEETFQEYLNIFFKVPRIARMTPLARVFDFIATGVPGPRDMLLTGKIAYEERQRESDDRPRWDLIVVDCAATGHVLGQLTAARSMMKLVRGGIIRSQVEWVDATISDRRRTALCITALPEEMPVVEAIELHDAVRRNDVPLGPCFLNRVLPVSLTTRQRQLAERLSDTAHAAAASSSGAGPADAVATGALLGDHLHRQGLAYARQLRGSVKVPVIEVPMVLARQGLATTRAVATALEDGA